jgi:uncharacterized protein (TIGR02117 family)
MLGAKPLPKSRRPIRVILRWLGRTIAVAIFVYASFLLLGCVPVNTSFAPATGDDRVVIYIRSNEIHTDLVLPVLHEASGCDWRERFPPQHFRGDVAECPYVAFGWGNRAFYVDTPTWADFKLSTAAQALFTPSESVLHVEYVPEIYPREYFRAVALTPEQYGKLIAFVSETIGPRDAQGRATTATERSYHSHDRFYASTGNYHVFNTCNQWTGRGLKRAGVTTGLWTPLKPQVLWWLQVDPGDKPSS